MSVISPQMVLTLPTVALVSPPLPPTTPLISNNLTPIPIITPPSPPPPAIPTTTLNVIEPESTVKSSHTVIPTDTKLELTIDDMITKDASETVNQFIFRKTYTVGSLNIMQEYNSPISLAQALLIGRFKTNNVFYGSTYDPQWNPVINFIDTNMLA